MSHSISSDNNWQDNSTGGFAALFYIFLGDAYLGWDCFSKNEVSIGSSDHADLVLKDGGIPDIQAVCSFVKGRIVIIDQAKNNGLSVNSVVMESRQLGPFDYVTIGPFTLKIKTKSQKDLNRVSSIQTSTHSFSSLPLSQKTTGKPRTSLGKTSLVTIGKEQTSLLPVPISKQKTEETVCGETVLRPDLEGPEEKAEEEKTVESDETGITVVEKHPRSVVEMVRVKEDDETEVIKPEPVECAPGQFEFESDYFPEKENSNAVEILKTISVGEYGFDFDEEDEDDDEDEEASFLLKDRLIDENRSMTPGIKNRKSIEVVKYRDDTIVDVRFLNEGEKYTYSGKNGNFCIAENVNSSDCYFYFSARFKAKFPDSSDEDCQNTDSLYTTDNLFNKRKKIYRSSLRKNGDVVVSDGYFDYLIREVDQRQSPVVPEPTKKKNHFYKNYLRSALIHIVTIFIVGQFSLTRSPSVNQHSEDDFRFVHVETAQLLPRKPTPPKIKKVPQLTKPVVNNKAPQKKSPRLKAKKRSRSQKRTKRSPQKKVASLSPATGGGSGKKGNVKNRNINKAGILSALGIADGIGIQPTQALAAVTNLDAVSSLNVGKNNFKVGGIVGKLGSSEIAIPTGAVVSTRGSNQVLRSGGGKGRLAALANGKTGQGQVRASVSASLSKKVHIRGGMSREAVKKVIDQHIEEISYCYETALIADPSLMGKIVYEWTILRSGSVGEVKVEFSSIDSGDIHGCIRDQIKSWTFPKPSHSEVVVSYPFIFDIVGF